MTITVFGAGSIGVFVGGSLLAAGADVRLIGRARMGERIARHGLSLTDLYGRRLRLDAASVPYTQDPAALSDADLILVTVKSADTAAAAEAIHAHAKPTALVLSLQNGVGNAEALRARLPGWTVAAGMVPFNVVQMEEGRFHRGTEGELMVEATPGIDRWRASFEAAHLPLVERSDFAAVQWGKLLLNLNNPVNALSDLPLKTELSQRAYRRCLALLMEEALAVLHAAGIAPAKIARVAPRLLPFLLRLPDPLFTRLAASMLRIDPEARSSMWEDLQAGRRTEVDYLNGAVVDLARSIGRQAPANQRILDLIHLAEWNRPAGMKGEALYRLLSAPAAGMHAERGAG
ncbi:2-dehydropantoate 2-reductase [Noviherbaspirillum massiliense]|nr:2-dehydropantoate 2-reductase [Noviherbaspirillum massiliense]